MVCSTPTLIISDIHLGSTLSCSEEVLFFLQNSSFKKLILLGDVFDGTHTHRFKEFDWQLLNYLEEIGKQGKEVIWISGNHDNVEGDDVEQIKNVNFVESYSWQEDHKKYCVIHGHQFDRMAVKNVAVKKITGKFHSLFASYMRNKRMAHIFDRVHTHGRRLSGKILRGAISYAEEKGLDCVICAHTHVPLSLKIKLESGKEIHYLNSGSWIQKPYSYIVVDKNGAELRRYAGKS
jgi:UDP-2,3-diacylglucosamine pyrophosphatase LpxH